MLMRLFGAPFCYQGLDVEKDHIIEMACIITDGKLNIIEEVILKQCPWFRPL